MLVSYFEKSIAKSLENVFTRACAGCGSSEGGFEPLFTWQKLTNFMRNFSTGSLNASHFHVAVHADEISMW